MAAADNELTGGGLDKGVDTQLGGRTEGEGREWTAICHPVVSSSCTGGGHVRSQPMTTQFSGNETTRVVEANKHIVPGPVVDRKLPIQKRPMQILRFTTGESIRNSSLTASR